MVCRPTISNPDLDTRHTPWANDPHHTQLTNIIRARRARCRGPRVSIVSGQIKVVWLYAGTHIAR
jgi:hypothetical protein